MAQAVASGATRLLGLFAGKNMTPEYQRTAGTTEPRLPEMTAAALEVLGKNKTGFFLMVEGSLIDSGNHAENHDYQFGETVAFDQSVKVVLDWIGASADRKNHTLLIVIPDHETGGFAVRGVGRKAGEVPGAGFAIDTTAGWAFTLVPGHKDDFESHHTGGDIVLWSQGPGSAPLGRAIDNTDVYTAVKNAMRAR
jgi:alkaline phosphatase